MDDIQVTQPSWRCPPCVNTSQQAGQRVNPTVPHLLLLPYNRNFTATGHQPCNPPTAMHVNLLPACRFPAQGGCRPAVNSHKHSGQFGTPCLQPTESMHTRGPTQHTNSHKPCLLQQTSGAKYLR